MARRHYVVVAKNAVSGKKVSFRNWFLGIAEAILVLKPI